MADLSKLIDTALLEAFGEETIVPLRGTIGALALAVDGLSSTKVDNANYDAGTGVLSLKSGDNIVATATITSSGSVDGISILKDTSTGVMSANINDFATYQAVEAAISNKQIKNGATIYIPNATYRYLNGNLLRVTGDGGTELTWAQFEALTPEQKASGLYYIPDAPNNGSAENVSYDNTTSELEATDVQSAIDELKEMIDEGGGSTKSIINITNSTEDLSGQTVTVSMQGVTVTTATMGTGYSVQVNVSLVGTYTVTCGGYSKDVNVAVAGGMYTVDIASVTYVNVVFSASEAIGATLTAKKGSNTKTATVQTGYPSPTAILSLNETGTWDINGRKITVSTIGTTMVVNEDIYGYDWTLTESNPESTISYPSTVTNAEYGHIGAVGTPAEINLGDWETFRDDFLECRPVMLNFDGTVAFELDHNDQTKKLDGSTSGITDTTTSLNAMVEFPKRYIKRWTDASNVAHFRISRMKVDSSYKCLPWLYGNSEATAEELDAIYMPMFPGSSVDSKVRSMATNGKPMNTNAGATEWTQIQALGTGWIFDDWSDKALITDFMFMMGKSTDVQKHHGYGNYTNGSSASSLLNIGGTKTYGSNYGGTGNSYIKFLWMENPYGDSWKRTMGVWLISGTLYVKDFPPYTTDGTVTNYNNLGRGIGGTNGGYMSAFTYDEHGMIPKTVSGSDSTYVPDGCWFNNSISAFLIWGGACSNGLRVGVSFSVYSAFSDSSWHISPALAYKYPRAA